jgi:KaiC/GvpD/RAD55 family RecA-like ATPase
MSVTRSGKKRKFAEDVDRALSGKEEQAIFAVALHNESVARALISNITPEQVAFLKAFGDQTVYIYDALRIVCAEGCWPASPDFWARLKTTLRFRGIELRLEEDQISELVGWADDIQSEGRDNHCEALALKRLPQFWTGLEISQMHHDLSTSGVLPSAKDFYITAEKIAAISASTTTSRLADIREGLEQRLATYRGRELLGLKTGIEDLDQRTDGLRDLTILGAKPGSGKTTKAIEIALGIARNVKYNNAAVIIVSADIPRETLYARMKCNLGGIEYTRLIKGSPELKTRKKGKVYHSAKDVTKIKKAERALDKLNDRIFLVGTESSQQITASSLTDLVRQAKKLSNLPRTFLVIDYLQLLAVPAGLDELSADRYRITEIQRVIETSRKQGDDMAAVLAISEMRKPVGERKTKDWGTGVEDLMGTARLGYAAEAILLCRRLTLTEMGDFYPGIRGNEGKVTEIAAERKIGELAGNGISPVMFALAKGRDGTRRGKWAEEFHFNKSQFKIITAGRHLFPECIEE